MYRLWSYHSIKGLNQITAQPDYSEQQEVSSHSLPFTRKCEALCSDVIPF